MSTAAVPKDPGKIRGLQRVTSEAGFFEICALDHLSDFAELLADDPSTVTFGDVVTAKDALVRALSPSVSAFLLDARYGLQAVATGALPGTVGLMSRSRTRTTRSRTGRAAPGTGRTGACARSSWRARTWRSCCGSTGRTARRGAEHQRYVVRSLTAECARLSLPLVVEPIWYPCPAKTPDRHGVEGGPCPGHPGVGVPG